MSISLLYRHPDGVLTCNCMMWLLFIYPRWLMSLVRLLVIKVSKCFVRDWCDANEIEHTMFMIEMRWHCESAYRISINWSIEFSPSAHSISTSNWKYMKLRYDFLLHIPRISFILTCIHWHNSITFYIQRFPLLVFRNVGKYRFIWF